MTQDPNRDTNPGDETTAWTPPQASPGVEPSSASAPASQPPASPASPPFEPAGVGASAPAQTVSRETGTFGVEPAAPAGRRASGLRWAIALGGVALVAAATIAILALAGGRPTPSIAVGYMPADAVSYSEYRLDFPGDQRQKLAAVLSKFPGFDDQAALDTKLREALDQILGTVTSGEQLYSRDIEPWFGGTIAMGSGPLPSADQLGGMAGPFAGGQLIVVSVKDATIAADWVRDVIAEGMTESPYGDATIFTSSAEFGSGWSIAINSEVILAGADPAVRAAVDSKGEGNLADDPEFKAAFETVNRDYVLFSHSEPRATLASFLAMTGPGGTFDTMTLDDELLLLMPAWTGTVAWLEDDALVSRSTTPSIDVGFQGSNRRGTLAGHVPASTVVFGEVHDVGQALTAFINRLRELPDTRETFGQIDQSAGMIGGIDGLIGWWGDAAIAVSELEDGSIGGGLLIAPTDAAAAGRTFTTLRSLLNLAGGGMGIEIRDVPHGDATITVIDLSAAVGDMNGGLPPGVTPEIAYTVTEQVVAIGYGEDWVASVLDAPGSSLAEDDRYEALLARIGAENMGVGFVDIQAIRELIEPLAEADAPADQWSVYVEDIKPYLLPFDALIFGSRKDGEVDRIEQVVTVK